jgi:hypothetical protein
MSNPKELDELLTYDAYKKSLEQHG